MYVHQKRLPPHQRQLIVDWISTWIDSLGDSPAEGSIKKSIFKKLAPSRRNNLLRKKALHTFLETEKACRESNFRISLSLRGVKPYADSAILLIASRKIASILGRFDRSEMLSLGRFGPGATFLCRGEDVSRARKFRLSDVTPEFQQQAGLLIAEGYPLWTENLTDSPWAVPLLTPVRGGRYSTVLKDETTDRSIIVEPTINSWFQQAIGRMIRSRLLKKCGVNLDDQTTNRRLARLGSVSDDLATVDFSSASDLISWKLVYDLLPPEWFDWLNLTRSHSVLIDGEWVRLEKFSSMGNGFTFDLQSLIFYALSWSLASHYGYNTFWVNVFGDDLIMPSGLEEPFLELCLDVGFQVNVRKSFFKGPFRESCGHDYFNGENIRGVYCKVLETDIDVMRLHNRFTEWSARVGIDCREITETLRLWKNDDHPYVPPSLGDLGWYASFDEALPPIDRHGWEGFRVSILVPVFKRHETFERDLLLDRLFGIPPRDNLEEDLYGREAAFARNSLKLREDPIGYRVEEVTSLWEDILQRA